MKQEQMPEISERLKLASEYVEDHQPEKLKRIHELDKIIEKKG